MSCTRSRVLQRYLGGEYLPGFYLPIFRFFGQIITGQIITGQIIKLYIKCMNSETRCWLRPVTHEGETYITSFIYYHSCYWIHKFTPFAWRDFCGFNNFSIYYLFLAGRGKLIPGKILNTHFLGKFPPGQIKLGALTPGKYPPLYIYLKVLFKTLFKGKNCAVRRVREG